MFLHFCRIPASAPVIKAHLACPRLRASSPNLSRWRRRRAQSRDEPQDFLEHLSRHGDLRHLEGHVAPVDDELRADLHELFPQAGQRPFLDAVRQRQRPQEVCKIVRERVKLKPDGVGGERAAGQSCPSNRAVALLD